MNIYNKRIRFWGFFYILINMLFRSDAAEQSLNLGDPSARKAEKILEFICSQASLNKPTLPQVNLENSLNAIMKRLEDKKVFKAVTKSLMENTSFLPEEKITPIEQGILLSLCIYQYCKETGLYWSHLKEEFGVIPEVNLFFDEAQPEEESTAYKVYPTAPQKAFFVQLVGRGNHNHSYLLWNLKMEDGQFKAILLPIPSYIKESKLFPSTSTLTARNFSYNPQTKHFLVKVKSGNVEGSLEEENLYQVEDEKLTLLEQKTCKKECIVSVPVANR